MSKDDGERTAAIMRLYYAGKRQTDIAREFGLSAGYVRDIIKQARRRAERRVSLERKYGAQPDIAALPDTTPIEVLELCDGDIHGWPARVASLSYAYDHPIKSLADLRASSDAQLLKIANVGKKMVAELRRFCPSDRPPKAMSSTATPGTPEERALEQLIVRVRRLPRARQMFVIDAMKRVLDEP